MLQERHIRTASRLALLLGLAVSGISLITACEDHAGGISPLTKQLLAEGSSSQPPVAAVTSVGPEAKAVSIHVEPDSPSKPTDLDDTTRWLTQQRIFEEPLVPIQGMPEPEDSQALADALKPYIASGDPKDLGRVSDYLREHAATPWRASLLLNVGLCMRRHGWFTQARDHWHQAWSVARADKSPHGRAIADRAIGELIAINAWVGRTDVVDELIAELGERVLTGPGQERVSQARAGRALMQTNPEKSFRCGPYAIQQLIGLNDARRARHPDLQAYPSTAKGTNLLELRNLAAAHGLALQVARRRPGAALIIPSLVHWSLGHFGSLTARENGRVQLEDATLDSFYGKNQWMQEAAVDAESSGYFLIADGPLPAGWEVVPDDEAADIWGRGAPTGFDNDNLSDGDPTCGGGCAEQGMPTYQFMPSLVSLRIADIPIAYAPPKGPKIAFRIVFNQREVQQPAVFSYSNLGSRWTHSWFSYVQDDPTITTGNMNALIYLPGGGVARFTVALSNGGTSGTSVTKYYKDASRLSRTSAAIYERTMADGTIYSFGHSDGSTVNPRKIFLTRITDPQGNQVNLTYDGSHRLTSIIDSIGQVSTVSYQSPTDPLKITRVSDPFGRSAQFGYDAQGRLVSVTDQIGMTSTFAYTGTGDVVSSMTTPYGETTFAYGETGLQRWITATDPLGNQERVEYRDFAPGIDISEPVVPTGTTIPLVNDFLGYRNSFYWDKKASKLHPGDYTKAVLYHWLHVPFSNGISGTMESMRTPTTRRVWFLYPGQTNASYLSDVTLNRPSVVAQVLSDGSTQQVQFSYSDSGRVTRIIDPIGRRTDMTYDANGIDLKRVDQYIDTFTSHRLATFTYGAVPHVPYSVSDAAGSTTTFNYNGSGQVTRVTNAKNEVTEFVYTTSGYLDRVRDPALAETIFTYDGFGRPRTVKNPDQDVVTFDYDLLDRPTQVTYPDGSSDIMAYQRLDLEWTRDRQGRWTRIFTNALRQTVAVKDPLSRITVLEWCLCGQLGRLIDPLGRVTKFDYDLSGRLIGKIYPDGRANSFSYDATGRLITSTDAKGQTSTFTYTQDDRIASVVFGNSVIPTSGVSYLYDPKYPRMSSMTDGIGTTTYTYKALSTDPVNNPLWGAGQLESIDGPWANDTVVLSYDQLGRVTGQSINGSSSSVVFDNLGRVDSLSNPLGAFDYAYEGATSRLASVLYPNAQQTVFSYLGGTQDRRLQSIANKKSATGPNISTFTYGYDVLGRITSWTRQNDAASATTYSFGYDRADQLVSAVLQQGATALESYGYTYDAGGNRTQRHRATVGAVAEVVNGLNQLVAEQTTGELRISGNTDEAAAVTINGQPTENTGGNAFTGTATVSPGANTVTVQATDGSGNVRTKLYDFTNPNGAGRSFSYDLNGNTVNDGIRTYTWDAKDQLASIEWTPVVGTVRRTEFTYNGAGQRVKMVEKSNGAVTSTITYLWVGSSIAEERDATGGTVQKRFLTGGMMVGATKYFFTADHLGSIREVTDASGNLVSRFDYDPYGNRTQVSGTFDLGLGYTGHWHHSSGVVLTWFRTYDPQTARWLKRDPIGERDGTNLYAYVGGDPVNFTDPFGLKSVADRKREQDEAILGSYGGDDEGRAVAAQNIACASMDMPSLVGLGFAAAFAIVEYATGGVITKVAGRALSVAYRWTKTRFLYEIGQKTLPDSVYRALSHMSPLRRGVALWRNEGWKSVIPNGSGWWLGIGKTFSTMPTPGGWIGIGLGGGGLAYGVHQYWKWLNE